MHFDGLAPAGPQDVEAVCVERDEETGGQVGPQALGDPPSELPRHSRRCPGAQIRRNRRDAGAGRVQRAPIDGRARRDLQAGSKPRTRGAELDPRKVPRQIGPDGVAKAWTLTDDSGAETQ